MPPSWRLLLALCSAATLLHVACAFGAHGQIRTAGLDTPLYGDGAGAPASADMRLVYDMHRRMYEQGVHGVLSAVAVRTARALGDADRSELSTCLRRAGADLVARAQCLSAAFDRRPSGHKPELNLITAKFAKKPKTAGRFQGALPSVDYGRPAPVTSYGRDESLSLGTVDRGRAPQPAAKWPHPRRPYLTVHLSHDGRPEPVHSAPSSLVHFRARRRSEPTAAKYYRSRRALARLAAGIDGNGTGASGEDGATGGGSSLWGTVAGVLTDVVRFLKGEQPTGGDGDKDMAELDRLYRLQKIMDEHQYHDAPEKLLRSALGSGRLRNLNSTQRYLLSMLGTFSKVAHSQNYSSLSLFSPKLLSLSPADPSVKRLLSPRFLSLYKEDTGSLHSILDNLGTEPETRDAWLALVVEATNSDRTVDKIFRILEQQQQREQSSQTQPHFTEEQLAKAHLRLSRVWDRYEKSFNSRQKRSIKEEGFAFLEKRQYDILYGTNGPYKRYRQLAKVHEFEPLSGDEKQFVLEQRIRLIARNASAAHDDDVRRALSTWDRRLAQSVLEPSVFSPGVLSPSVFGHTTLSPSLFSPSILSPGVLGPTTLSPSIGNPSILSPSVLSPYTLSPSLLNPSILSPYVLGPAILNPYGLGPAILSPHVLSPSVLSPTFLSGSVLSPCVLGPSVLSPGVLNADVLSPGVLC